MGIGRDGSAHLGLRELIEMLDWFGIPNNSLHHLDCNFRLLDEIILSILNLESRRLHQHGLL